MNTTYIILSVFLIISVIGLIIIGSLYYFTARISKSFKEQENDYKTLSKESLESIIEPFKNRIKEFEDEIKKNSEQQLKLHVETKTTIDGLIEKTNQITSDTTNLTKALKGDSKTQGDYGEMKLRMLLENSGLEENVHYRLQENFTVTDEDGVKNKRPDAVIYLPQKRHIIIDSKFSFREYDNYCSADISEREEFGKKHSRNLKERIKELSETKYHEIDKLTTPDITFLFLGIDDALNVGLKYDKDLLTFATKKQIALISPSQLHISIKMVENLWRIDGQKESVFMVYEEAQKLVEKLNGFMTVMESLENSINQTQKKFNDAKNKLVDGTGSITSRVKKLIALGDKEINKKDD